MQAAGVPLDRIEGHRRGVCNVAHEGLGDPACRAALAAGFPDSVPAVTVNRFVASSLVLPIFCAGSVTGRATHRVATADGA